MNKIENKNLSEINLLNQRGGRMLSIVDLMRSGTVSHELATYLIIAINRRASFLVGAKPGGAGKTTVMAALLGLLPFEERIMSFENEHAVKKILEKIKEKHESKLSSKIRLTLVCHEISSGSWYGYLWGPVVKDYFNLTDYSVRVASNIHADNLEEVLGQLTSFGVTMKTLTRVQILIFLKMFRGADYQLRRRVTSVLEAQKIETSNWKYKEVFCLSESGEICMKNKSNLVPLNKEYEETLEFVNRIKETKEVNIEAVRKKLHDFFAESKKALNS